MLFQQTVWQFYVLNNFEFQIVNDCGESLQKLLVVRPNYTLFSEFVVFRIVEQKEMTVVFFILHQGLLKMIDIFLAEFIENGLRIDHEDRIADTILAVLEQFEVLYHKLVHRQAQV